MASEDHRMTSDMNILGWSPYRFSAVLFIGMGLIPLVLAIHIVTNGDVVYGLLYTGPAIISWILAYAFWRIEP